ncbi:type II secretion system protein [bacterium]|nr:type II secretion system protein [bacterium]
MKKGFTLAEVLITLGIIGVVAAITLSTLIKNYQKHVWVNQLKKEYSILSQGFQKMMADDGVTQLSDTTVFGKIQNGCTAYHDIESADCKDFLNEFKKYFKVISIDKDSEYKIRKKDSSNYYTYNENIIKLADGSFLIYHNFSKNGNDTRFDLDINGKKGPNTYGRDIFYFNYRNNGKMVPLGSAEGAHYWKTAQFYYGLSCGKDSENGDWGGCLARIIEEGWKMNY